MSEIENEVKRGPGRPRKVPAVTNEERPEGLQSVRAVTGDEFQKLVTPATDLPRRGTAILYENISLGGSLPFMKQGAFTGDVEFWPGSNIPAGVWVDVKDPQRAHAANIDRHWFPATSCAAITLKKKAT